MSIEIGKTALITTDDWFVAPDGRQYRAVFGTVTAVRDDQATLGIKTNRGSSNWYVEIGNMIIAGCQIHYAIRADKYRGTAVESVNSDGKKQCLIYNADEDYGR